MIALPSLLHIFLTYFFVSGGNGTDGSGARTISIENKHRSYCFKNYSLLHLSTQTFPKNIIVNHLLNGEKRRKSKRLPAQRRKNRSAICNDVIGQNWSRGPCPTPPGSGSHKSTCWISSLVMIPSPDPRPRS